jgi:hypothetical protein
MSPGKLSMEGFGKRFVTDFVMEGFPAQATSCGFAEKVLDARSSAKLACSRPGPELATSA